MLFEKSYFKACIAMFLILICFFAISCKDSAKIDNPPVLPPEIVTGDETPDVANSEIEFVYLGSADNLLIRDNSAATASFFSLKSVQNSGLLTIDASGDFQPISMKGGARKHFRKVNKIDKKNQGTSRVKAILEGWDETTGGKTEWHLIDRNDRSHKLKGRPHINNRHKHLKNSPMFVERGKIYYLDTTGDLMELDISDDVSQDRYNIVRSGVEHAVMDRDGNWMLSLSSGRVVHRDVSGDLETRMNDNTLNNDAEVNKFFMAQGRGFLFMGTDWGSPWGVFFRAFLDQGQLQVVSAQTNNNDWLYFYPHNDPSVCSYQIVRDEELLICGNYVYQLGDASRDMNEINFQWAGYLGAISYDHIKVAASPDYIYYYSNSNFEGARLTRIDIVNQTCLHLFSKDNTATCSGIVSNVEYIIEPATGYYAWIGIDQLTATDDNTVRFCGHKFEQTQLFLVEIVGADTATPLYRETAVAQCGQLSNL